MVTDPPYGVEYDAEWRNEVDRASIIDNRKSKAVKAVENDNEADWPATWSLSPSKVSYIWHAGKHAATVQYSLEKSDFEIRYQIIWKKPQGIFGRGHYNWQHEPCWYAVKKGSKGNWAGDKKQTTIWEISGMSPFGRSAAEGDKKTGHSTQKPVECMGRPLENHDGDVYDPFLGSGTTMVAAQQLGRVCYGMEINPEFCQIVIDRMKALNGDLVVKVNGKKIV